MAAASGGGGGGRGPHAANATSKTADIETTDITRRRIAGTMPGNATRGTGGRGGRRLFNGNY